MKLSPSARTCISPGTYTYSAFRVLPVIKIFKYDILECVDHSPNICRRHEANCDLHPETRQWRLLCPVTCGACGDYGT